MILFVKNGKSVEMSNIGVVKYKHVGCIDLKDLKKIDIKDIVDEGRQVQIYPHNGGIINQVYTHDDRSLYLLYTVAGYGRSSLTLLNMDSVKKNILPSKIYNSQNYGIEQFTKHKNNIFVYSGNCLERLNLDLYIAKTVNIGYDISFLSANDAHVYMYRNKKLYIYQNDLKPLNQVGQSNNSTGAFYFPTDIKQFESHKGMYYWLNNTNLQILREEDGQLVKSVSVTTNNFIIDSNDK